MSDIVLSAGEVKALRDAVLINASGEAIGLDLPAIKQVILSRMAQAWDKGYLRCSDDFERYHNGEPGDPNPLERNPYR